MKDGMQSSVSSQGARAEQLLLSYSLPSTLTATCGRKIATAKRRKKGKEPSLLMAGGERKLFPNRAMGIGREY